MNNTNEENKKNNNDLALLGFIFSLLGCLAVPGLILSIIGLVNCNEYKNDRKGLAIAGVVISSVIIVFSIILLVIPSEDKPETIDNPPKSKEDAVCVTFMVDDNQYSKKCGERGFKVEKPTDPTKDGYEFKYWSTVKNSTSESDKYDFDLYVNIDKTIYSIFTEKAVAPSNNTQSNTNTTPPVSGYESIYNLYSERLRNECPNLSITECATLANEGVGKMAQHMYASKGTEGQYATYEAWATKLYNVYIESAR